MIGLEGAVISTNERAAVASSPQAAASSVSSGKRTVRVGFKVDPLGISFEDSADGLHSCSLELVAAAFDESDAQTHVSDLLGTRHSSVRASNSDIGDVFQDVRSDVSMWRTTGLSIQF